MKAVINSVLTICAVALIYICYASIMGPINFKKEKAIRDKAVIARLMDIRKAQQEYHMRNHGVYTASFDTLIDFVQSQKIPLVKKIGILSDSQLENGLTEQKAVKIVNAAKKTHQYNDVKKWGLENFSRDTMWISILDTVFPKGFVADSMRYIPYGNGAKFEMKIKNDKTKSGAPVHLYEVKAPYDTYLNGLDKQEIANIKDMQTKLGKYSGLMIGSIDSPNNGAGNWE
ncbi:MAG: hypothetical protein WCR45_02110 [Bacteroidaceae bacterium]